MDYEKAYKQALERARKLYNEAMTNDYVSDMEDYEQIFPEHSESEDEKIRKEMFDFFNQLEDKKLRGVDISSWIAWLEKQKPIEVDGDEYGIDGLWHAVRILKKTLGTVEGYQSDDGMLEHKAAITAVEKLKTQKPAERSKENEKMFESVMTC